ncbi:hypothetical protein [Citromicrobium bathyomarinum]|uniref:hypothetical protein n=1 Tax=Citromicrobium bathyomarinum TaxID=72174 RepID=UPI001E3E685E|nr:hypothetical protein [Citromicrobium bathyomarinum]MCD1622331.1 hypothetical protein [Citromicrobium bathyomarinum]
MTDEEWRSSTCATEMLRALYAQKPRYFRSQSRQLHRFLIACCWKHGHLIPQEGIREGLRGAERWIAGEISDDELNRLNWHAEGEAFRLDYAKTPSDFAVIRALVADIPQLDGVPFADSHALLTAAAYFAEGSMVYPTIRPGPWIESLFASQFVCPDLLREYLTPRFGR